MDWKNLISTIAPWIGTALGGPLGGAAVTAIGGALGLDKPTEDSIKQALSGVTPEQMLAIKQADNDFALKMQQAGFADLESLEKIAADDRASARAMESTTRSRVPATLSLVVTVGLFAVLLGMLLGWLHVTDSQALLLMLGSLTTGWGSVMAYWFGTTHDSARKTDLLAKANTNG
jgi:hypothetical protein